jgi:hypothetical protein
MATINEKQETVRKDKSPMEEMVERLFGKLERLEHLTGHFIDQTASVRLEIGAESDSLETKASQPMSPLEAQIDDAIDTLDMLIYRVEQALAELRL